MTSGNESDVTDVVPTQQIEARLAAASESAVDDAVESVDQSPIQEKDLRVSIACIPSPVLSLDIYVDAAEKKAMFKIRAFVFLRQPGNNRTPLYLFVYPENIRALRLVEDQKTELHFELREPPLLVVPKSVPVNPKAKSEDVMQALKTCATRMTELTVVMAADVVATKLELLRLTCNLLIPGDFHTDAKFANLSTLYSGKGGQVAQVGQSHDKEIAPPAYEELTSSESSNAPAAKRRRTGSIDKVLLTPTTTVKAPAIGLDIANQVKHRIETAIEPIIQEAIQQVKERLAKVVQETLEELIEAKDVRKRVTNIEDQQAGLEDFVASLDERQDGLEADIVNVEESLKYDIHEVDQKVDDLHDSLDTRIRDILPEILQEGLFTWQRL